VISVGALTPVLVCFHKLEITPPSNFNHSRDGTNSNAIPTPYVYALATAAASFSILCTIIAMAWKINAMERQLRDLSLRDELTKLYNRRGFYFLAGQAFREAARADTPV
jgi:hypothetical protein